MIRKLAFLAVGAFVFVGCGGAVTNAVNGDTTAEDIKAKQSILIVTQTTNTSCFILKTALASKYPNTKILTTTDNVTCATYGKDAYACKVQTIEELKTDNPDLDLHVISTGNESCVVGGDIVSN